MRPGISFPTPEEEKVGPDDAYVIPLGHDAWVVGGEPVVSVDVSRVTAEQYATGENDTKTRKGGLLREPPPLFLRFFTNVGEVGSVL